MRKLWKRIEYWIWFNVPPKYTCRNMVPDEFWDEVIRVNKEAFIRRETERFYREKFLPFWESLPWHVRLLVRCYVRLNRRSVETPKA